MRPSLVRWVHSLDTSFTALWQNDIEQTALSAVSLDTEVHIWRAVVSEIDLLRMELGSLLTPSERRRAETFKSPDGRSSFIARRALLRKLLSMYLNRPARDLAFQLNAYGKPRLSGCDVDFSVSTSCGVILLAFARRRRIGIDLEYTNVDFDYQAVADQNLAPSERQFLAKLSGSDARAAFFSYWTRKEAFVKALGCGLSMPLNGFEVPLVEASPVVLVGADRREELPSWRLVDLMIGSAYRAALAVEGSDSWVPRCMWPNGNNPGVS